MEKFKLIVTLFLFLTSFSVLSQETGITGVVTYFYNDYQGDKPDTGAKVYILDSISNPEIAINNPVENYLKAQLYVELTNLTQNSLIRDLNTIKRYGKRKKYIDLVNEKKKEVAESQEDLNKYKNKLHSLNADTKEKYESLSGKAMEFWIKIMTNESITKRTIDGTGSYKIPTKEGTYYVFINSKNRTHLNMLEINGQVFFTKVKVKNGQVKDISHNFTI